MKEIKFNSSIVHVEDDNIEIPLDEVTEIIAISLALKHAHKLGLGEIERLHRTGNLVGKYEGEEFIILAFVEPYSFGDEAAELMYPYTEHRIGEVVLVASNLVEVFPKEEENATTDEHE